MPGQVLDVKVKEGDSIKKGETVAVLSAMKVGWKLTKFLFLYHSSLIFQMETVVKSAVDGQVKKIHVQADQQVQGNDLIVELD